MNDICIIKKMIVIHMHDYLKAVLTKLSFNRTLFLKELSKSRRWLTSSEWDSLYKWAEQNHQNMLECDASHQAGSIKN